ncbi:alpha/beta hydrolase family protein [Phormidesmis sp. 146-12]
MILSRQLGYTFTAIAATANFATFEFSPTGVPIPTAPAINEKDQVAFWGANSPTDAGIFVGDGNSLRTVADLSGEFSFLGVGSSINDLGTVAFIAIKPDGEIEVLTGKGNHLTEIADSRGAFSSFRGVDINDRGTVAYLADFDTGGSGLFIGQQEIIATGDGLLGSTVTELDFLNKGLNQDSVAVWAKLADGRSGVGMFRADQNKPAKSPFSLDHLYNKIGQYTTTIAANGDPADVYFPQVPKSNCNSIEFPIVLLLQGALVDKADYSNFAKQVASYGFVVVVPNHERTLSGPNDQSVTGLFSEQNQVNDVLAQVKVEDQNAKSPLFKIIDTTKLGLLGHSFGGAVGLTASQQDIQVPGFSSPGYTRPPELKAGIFYGANLRNQQTNEALPINNHGIAIGLIQGDLDGVAAPINAQRTYDQIRNPPKALITVKGANHYGITNEDNPARDPNRPTLDQAAATSAIAKSSGLFLRAHILNDHRAFDALFNASTPFDPNISIISQTRPMPRMR